MHYSNFLALAVLPAAYGQLNQLAKAAGLTYFGSATDNSELTDTEYVAILSNTTQFGQITPGNTQKWYYTEPSNGTFTYTQGDVITSFAANNSQLVRCHNLVWYSQLPSWITTGTWTNQTLVAAMKAHIQSEVTHYKGQCYAWDVVNEALADDATYRTDVFYNTIGPEYIAIAFETAALYDPDVKLYYNDYNIETAGAKQTAALQIVQTLIDRGIKIDGVGLQGHFIVGETATQANLVAGLEAFTALGVEVAYTELDIRFTTLPPTAAGLVQQGTDYANTVSACLAVDGCVGVTIWDYTDKYSWIPSTFSGQGDACLWYANFTVHPAYYSVVSVLSAAASTAVPVTSTASLASTTSISLASSTVVSSVASSVVVAVASSTPLSSSVITTTFAPLPTTLVATSVASIANVVSASSVVASSSTKKTCSKVSTASSVVAAASSSVASQAVSSSRVAVSSVIAASSTLKTSLKVSSVAATATGSGSTVALYGQCGGANWTGSTVCASGSTCTKQNDYYSQCIAA